MTSIVAQPSLADLVQLPPSPANEAERAGVDDSEGVRLARQAVAGDAKAFGDLVANHERAALAIAFGCCGNADRAADAVQEACLLAWRKRAALEDPARFSGWFMHIVRRCAIDQVRRHPARREAALGEGADRLPSAPPPEPAADEEERDLIRSALEDLDEPSRIAVTMRYYDGSTSRDIAEVLECSPPAVDMRLKRARDTLRSKLGRWFGEPQ